MLVKDLTLYLNTHIQSPRLKYEKEKFLLLLISLIYNIFFVLMIYIPQNEKYSISLNKKIIK